MIQTEIEIQTRRLELRHVDVIVTIRRRPVYIMGNTATKNDPNGK